MVGIVLPLLALRSSIGVVACLTAESGPLVDLNDACTGSGGGGLARSIDVASNQSFRGTTGIHCTRTDVRLVHSSNKAVFGICIFVPRVAYRRLIGATCFSTEGLGLVELKARLSIKLPTTMATGDVSRTFA